MQASDVPLIAEGSKLDLTSRWKKYWVLVSLIPTYRVIPGAIELEGLFTRLTVPIATITHIEHVWWPDIERRQLFWNGPMITMGNHVTEEWVLIESTEAGPIAITPDDTTRLWNRSSNKCRIGDRHAKTAGLLS